MKKKLLRFARNDNNYLLKRAIGDFVIANPAFAG